MAMQPETGRLIPDPILDVPIPYSEVSVELRDWRRTHRPISDEHRSAARTYVRAIIRHDLVLRSCSPEEQQSFADGLWRRFREAYDDPRHGEEEDFLRALARL